MTRKILLTQGKVALVDDADYDEQSLHKWYALKNGNTHYAVRNSPRDPVTHKQTLIPMHAVIAGTPKEMDTDHINGDGLDNRCENLRVVTHRENTQNKHTPKTSKYPGVSWDKQYLKWKALIRVNGKHHYLGRYTDEDTAGIVYAMACNALKMKVTL